MKVRIAPGGFEFETAPEQTLLRAADAAGIELPSSCRNGTCRTCICLLREGQVRHTIDWPGLSAEEKTEGWILPCVAQPLSDVTLEVPQAFSVFGDA
ncbi:MULTISPECIES: 2Fe-2S iron-sulfur cluster-binding protein [unclassified Variovorax]|uniref:2Fe-2S iron-sulfur cluster-binding protein n=1 Tax=unclassified Variovorax TaxID=663243 RepID=UPI0025791BFB|nr:MULTISPECIES: 2Fe-2S iron-sulfur cluster-binding protein [unclassified Variovorax]MDM0087299.1 2Fe-2S iron-sulfur cluster-binding protein [Variovorax sp. J22G40]MDM0144444.1 2Fe-2S iron-sulfur cluster-binding protein [Variovorax sp. J2P1-31]